MNTLMTILGITIGLAFLVYHIIKQDKIDSDDNEIVELFNKLKIEVSEVKLLVSTKCPENSEAETLVIEAAQCLIIPSILAPQTCRSRYEQGFIALDKARQLAQAQQPAQSPLSGLRPAQPPHRLV